MHSYSLPLPLTWVKRCSYYTRQTRFDLTCTFVSHNASFDLGTESLTLTDTNRELLDRDDRASELKLAEAKQRLSRRSGDLHCYVDQ